MIGGQGRRDDITRREAMGRALKAGVYAAPVLLSASALAERVGASPPPVPAIACGTAGLAFSQDALLLNVAPASAYTVYAQPNTAPAPAPIGTITADAEGVAAGVFALAAPFGTTSVTLSVYLTPGGGAPPGPAAATFVSPIAGTLACTIAGQVLPVTAVTARLLAKVVQEQTGCPAGAAGTWSEVVDANVANGTPGATYDVYLQANNGTGGFVRAGSVATNGQGNGGGILTVAVGTTGAAPTGVTVVAVPAGSAPTAAGGLTFAAAGTGSATTSSLFTVSCAGTITSLSAPKALLIGVR
jgi:hypothetical protein